MSGRLVIGIDLGTTNSLAAVRAGQSARVLRAKDGNPLVPSFVCFLPDGATAVGTKAKDLRLQHPDRTIFSAKRLIGRAGPEVDAEAATLPYPVRRGERDLARIVVGEREHAPEQVAALILREVKQQAEQALAATVDAAVITVPAWFDDAQRQATRDAAQLAGIECLRILNEPTAASLAYGIDGSKDGTVLVYDLGGGTFDVSILKIEDGVFRVLATAGDTHLGGDDFDQILVERVLSAAGGAAKDAYVMQAVRAAAEGLKFQLSEREHAELQLELIGQPTQTVRVARADFEAWILPLVDRTMECCRRALKDAGLEPEELDDVLLVGGSTRVPCVRARLEQQLGKKPKVDIDPDQAVALGAAIQADVLAGNDRSLLLLDVLPLSLGIETLGGAMQKLILRNSTIPTSATEEFSTALDGQTTVLLNIHQGERELALDCRKIGSFTLGGLPPMPAGLPRIAVTFLVDADGVLRVTAVERRSGQEATITVVPSYGLSRDEVRRMMLDSIEHAQQDYVARETIDLRNKAQAMVTGTQRALQLADLPPDQTFAVQKSARQLEKLLQQGADSAALKQATDELGRLTATIADDVISSAVQRSLQEEQQKTKP